MWKTLNRNVQHLEALVGKVMEENTNREADVGVTVERREFDLWPLVEALVHDLQPIVGTGTTRLTNTVPEDLVVYADASLVRRAEPDRQRDHLHAARRSHHRCTGGRCSG